MSRTPVLIAKARQIERVQPNMLWSVRGHPGSGKSYKAQMPAHRLHLQAECIHKTKQSVKGAMRNAGANRGQLELCL